MNPDGACGYRLPSANRKISTICAPAPCGAQALRYAAGGHAAARKAGTARQKLSCQDWSTRVVSLYLVQFSDPATISSGRAACSPGCDPGDAAVAMQASRGRRPGTPGVQSFESPADVASRLPFRPRAGGGIVQCAFAGDSVVSPGKQECFMQTAQNEITAGVVNPAGAAAPQQSTAAANSGYRDQDHPAQRRRGGIRAQQDHGGHDQGLPRRQRRAGRASCVRELVEQLTQGVVARALRSRPNGGTFHIEDVQDHVELALMRSGEHEVARAYVLYREKRTQERARPAPGGGPRAAGRRDGQRHRRRPEQAAGRPRCCADRQRLQRPGQRRQCRADPAGNAEEPV